MRGSRYGVPFPIPAKSAITVLLVEPTLGLRLDQPPTDLQLGQTPSATNFMLRDGALQLRPTLSRFTGNENPIGFVTGGFNVVSSVGSAYPLVSGQTQFAYYSAASWSPLSYISTAGLSAPPSGGTRDYYDIIQSYAPTVDDNIAIAACESYQTLFCWESGSTVFSSITSAPRARFVGALDNFVLALNIRDTGSAESKYVQRLQWSDRGDPLNWAFGAGSLAGFEDLLDARGQGTRIMVQDNRAVLFFEEEIWVAFPGGDQEVIRSEPYDRNVGCPYSWTIASTPAGIVFLGKDMMVYLLPKAGGPAQPIGQGVQRMLRDRISGPDRAWAVYDPDTTTYQLNYPTRAGTGVPQEALWLNVNDATFAPQSFVHTGGQFSLSRGFSAINNTQNNPITWAQLQSDGVTWASLASTWQGMEGSLQFGARVNAAADSSGTIYYYSNGTTDDGIPVQARWRSGALMPDTPERTKVVQEVRVDYQSNNVSTISVAVSRDQGDSFDPPVAVTMPITSTVSNVVAHTYTPGRYPTFEVRLESQGPRLSRFWTKIKLGGR